MLGRLVSLPLLAAGVAWLSSAAQDVGRVRVETRDRTDGSPVAARLYVLDKEVERLEAGPGAVALLGLRSPIRFDGYRLHPPDSVFCERARQQGAYIDAEKIVWRDGAALAAFGLIDFVGIVHNHFNRHDVELETDRWGTIRVAHTSPVYVDVGRPAPAVEEARFFLEWIDREIRLYTAETGFRDPRHREELLDLFRTARRVYARLTESAGPRR